MGGQAESEDMAVKYSEAVSKAAGSDFIFGVFNQLGHGISAGTRQYIGAENTSNHAQ